MSSNSLQDLNHFIVRAKAATEEIRRGTALVYALVYHGGLVR